MSLDHGGFIKHQLYPFNKCLLDAYYIQKLGWVLRGKSYQKQKRKTKYFLFREAQNPVG